MSDEIRDALSKLEENMLEEKAQLEERLSGVNQVIEGIHQIESSITEMERSSSVLLAGRLGLVGTGTKEDDPPMPVLEELLATKMRDKTLEDAMILYARAKGGIFNSYEGRRVLVKAGLLKGTAGSISSRLHEALTNSEHFVPLGEKKGRWKLITDDPSDINSVLMAAQKRRNLANTRCGG